MKKLQEVKEEILKELDQKYADRGNYPYYAEIRDSVSQSLDRLEQRVREETYKKLYIASKDCATMCPWGDDHKTRMYEDELELLFQSKQSHPTGVSMSEEPIRELCAKCTHPEACHDIENKCFTCVKYNMICVKSEEVAE